MTARFRDKITVSASVIDALNHVNNIAYLQWCLDAAQRHWTECAPTKLQIKYAWVVLHHYIEYQNPAFLGDKLEVTTWVTSVEGVKSERCYHINRPKDGSPIVKAQTLWCLLDAATHRPTKIPEEIRTLFT